MPHVATEQYAEVAEQCTARSQSEPSTRTALLVESRHLGLLILATASRPFFLAAQREFRLDSAAAVSRWGGQGRGRRTGADFPLPRVVSQSEWVVVVPTDRRGSCRSPRHQPHNSRTASHGSSSLPGLGSRVFGSEAGASSFHGQLWNAGRAPRSLRRTTTHDRPGPDHEIGDRSSSASTRPQSFATLARYLGRCSFTFTAHRLPLHVR